MTVNHRNLESAVPTSTVILPIAVGVDGTDSCLVAVEWAAAEAARLGTSIRLVHAYPAEVFEYPATPIGRDRAEIAFDAARERLSRPEFDGLAVSTYAAQGSATRVLLRAAKESRMLVLGREHEGFMASLLSTSVSVAGGTHAAAPVTVVPATWSAPVTGSPLVVVGVDGSAQCQAAVEHAFGAAAGLGARVLAVLALDLPAGYPQGWPVRDERDRLDGEARRMLDESLARWRDEYPNVDVESVVDERSALEALLDLSTGAERLVIGGRGHGLVTGALLGSVARAVLRRTVCPVTVAHPHPMEYDDGRA